MIGRIALFIIMVILGQSASLARDWKGVVRPIKAGETIVLRPDKAYLLLRIGRRGISDEPVLLREPEEAEIAAYDAAKAAAIERAGYKGSPESFVFQYEGLPNLFALTRKSALMSDKNWSVVLAEVRPGRYVLYGGGGADVIGQCHCLGTVGFTADPGVVTDVGTYVSDAAARPSVYPELASETNVGPTASLHYALLVGGLIPPRGTEMFPPGLDRSKVVPVRLRAVGPFLDPNVVLVNRLAPIPGVLAYDGGKVIDVASGKEAPPR